MWVQQYGAKPCEGHSGSVYALSLNAEGSLLAAGSTDGTIRISDTRSRGVVAALKVHTENVRCTRNFLVFVLSPFVDKSADLLEQVLYTWEVLWLCQTSECGAIISTCRIHAWTHSCSLCCSVMFYVVLKGLTNNMHMLATAMQQLLTLAQQTSTNHIGPKQRLPSFRM